MKETSHLAGRYAIVGIGETGVPNAVPGDTALSLQCRAARSALLEAELVPRNIDAIFAHWDDRATALLVAEYLGIQPSYIDSTLTGGGSPLMHIIHAMAAIDAGLCKCALITYGSTQRLDRSRKRGGLFTDPRSPVGQFVLPYGILNPIGWNAMRASLYMHHTGATPEDLASVAMNARAWAMLNPDAKVRSPLTLDEYFASPMISDPLRKADICLVTDGAGAMIVTSLEVARTLPKTPVVIDGFCDQYLQHVTPFRLNDWLDDGVLSSSTERTLGMAGLSREDVSMIQIYDAFTIGVLTALESMGFCETGEAGEFLRSGMVAPGGKLPLNTSGGGLAFNHSGQFGMQLMLESIRQLRGECGERQVPNVNNCFVQAGGFVMSASMTMLLTVE